MDIITETKNLSCTLDKGSQKEGLNLFDIQAILNFQNSLSTCSTVNEIESQLIQALNHFTGSQNGKIIVFKNQKFHSLSGAEYSEQDLPLSVLKFTIQSEHQFVLAQFHNKKNPFENDTYFKSHSPKSLVCIPITRRSKKNALIYIENQTEEFSSNLFNIIELLANHTILAIENLNLNNELQDVIKFRLDFLSVASHELKTPLTPISLTAQIISRLLSMVTLEEPLRQKIDKSLDTLQNQIQRMAKLIDELLDLKRYAMNPVALRIEKVDLENLINSTLEAHFEELKNNKIQVILNLEKGIRCPMDPIRIRQALNYFITNAIKYGLNKPIEISTHSDHGKAHIQIKDHGIGISKKDQERIFQPFNRAISYIEVSGFGLGLYMAKQILDAHHIDITIESDLGKGSTFNLVASKIADF